jgi:3-hydroxyacyl-[acyl-carrier-protein] dehydratase
VASHSTERRFPPDDSSAEGHFPGNPIIPGAVLLREVVSVLAAASGKMCGEIVAAKFLHPVRPGDHLAITWEEQGDGRIGFICSTATPERRVLVGTMRMRPR